MASLADLSREHTSLTRDQIQHLVRLVSEWGMLSDFCVADLLLYVTTDDGRWLTIGQVRPATGQTIYHTDWVGSWANDTERPMLAKVFESGVIAEGDVQVENLPDQTRMLAIPVRYAGRNIAVLTKEWIEQVGRRPGELERTYQTIFDQFAQMICDGEFPFPTGSATPAPPRASATA